MENTKRKKMINQPLQKFLDELQRVEKTKQDLYDLRFGEEE